MITIIILILLIILTLALIYTGISIMVISENLDDKIVYGTIIILILLFIISIVYKAL